MMLPPRPLAYICRSAARVVRKAPSRWIASIFFHLAKSNWSTGSTIWMPALLTSTSTPPKASATLAKPASTWASSVTSMATPDGLAAGRHQFGRGRVGALLIEVGDHHLRALAGVDDGDLLADAAGGAGDDGNLVLQTHVFSPLRPVQPR